MTNDLFSRFSLEIKEDLAEKQAENYIMINVRPGEKVAAMMDVLAYLHKKSPSAAIADNFSQQLADYAASSAENASAILKATEKVVAGHGSLYDDTALGLLEKRGVLKIDSNPFLREFSL